MGKRNNSETINFVRWLTSCLVRKFSSSRRIKAEIYEIGKRRSRATKIYAASECFSDKFRVNIDERITCKRELFLKILEKY